MNNEELKENLKTYLQEYADTNLKGKRKAGTSTQYNCPFCSSGTGKNGTAAFTIKQNTTAYNCFSCGATGDIFSLFGQLNNTADFSEQLASIAKLYGNSKPQSLTSTQKQTDLTLTDYTDFYNKCHSNINNTDYWIRRGLTTEIIDKYNIGYCANWTHPNAPTAPPTPRLIIPSSNNSYLARATEQTDEQYSKQKVGPTSFFNLQALTQSLPVFVTEGEIDALSILSVGKQALALGGITGIDKFVKYCTKQLNNLPPLIIALDNDEAGISAGIKLSSLLTDANINNINADKLYRQYKDANAFLTNDNASFINSLNNAEASITQIRNTEYTNYINNSVSHQIEAFTQYINSNQYKYISTGFNKLDNLLGGGIGNGRTYLIGAVTSLGKSTFCMQIVDHIARTGTDVLVFNAEMHRFLLFAKSISRLTYKIYQEQSELYNLGDVKTANNILSADNKQYYRQAELNIISAAMKEYTDNTQHLYISDGRHTIENIRKTVEKHIQITGNIPVVLIDYFQLLRTDNLSFKTDKQKADYISFAISDISHSLNIPLICISSFNRDYYNKPVALEAFKETGNIEYDADVCIGLQYKGIGTDKYNYNTAREGKEMNGVKGVREIELMLLKNRMGTATGTISFNYIPAYNYFSEQ